LTLREARPKLAGVVKKKSRATKRPAPAKPVKSPKSVKAERGKLPSKPDAKTVGELQSEFHTAEARRGKWHAVHFPIVAVGASAGGIEALEALLRHLPAQPGMSFVVIQHLAPDRESILPQILARASAMPVTKAEEGLRININNVYVIPPNTNIGIARGTLRIMPRAAPRGRHMPVDFYLRCLAEDQKSNAIGVILSGADGDGTEGLKFIKAEGGIAFAQAPSDSRVPGMPSSAIAAGLVDFVLPVAEIAAELTRMGRLPSLFARENVDGVPEGGAELDKVFALLKTHTGVDFDKYKCATIQRRIKRRMVLNKLDTLAAYLEVLQSHAAERDALYQDLLINVTSFFREPEAFEALRKRIFPRILKRSSAAVPIRIWVPGCSTGEEAYSIAICLLEALADVGQHSPVQVFATDLSETAIERARLGQYQESIKADVSMERLRRFFTKVSGGYVINRAIRDMCVFARHDVTRDPPFSRMDFISCRNLLIYLAPVLQKKVMTFFSYAMNPDAYLMLGISETIGSSADLFSLVDKKNKIYLKKPVASRTYLDIPALNAQAPRLELAKRISPTLRSSLDIQHEVDRLIVKAYGPAGVVVNEELQIIQFRGHTGDFLQPAPGDASLNVLRMIRDDLQLELRALLRRAKKASGPVRKEGLEIRQGGRLRRIHLEAIPIDLGGQRHFAVLFEDAQPAYGRTPRDSANRDPRIQGAEGATAQRLKEELIATREYLQAIIQDLESTNEELQSANEEILSSNEELQSTNEELETAKEELQSTNEELTTVNEELANRNLQLSQANNDLGNLLASVNLPIVMVGNDLRIRRFTPMAEKLFNVIPTDVGRPITDIKPNFNLPHLESLILDTIESMNIKEFEIMDREGHWYSLRIRPYRTAENQIDGAVMILVDIDSLKRSTHQLKQSRDDVKAIVEMLRDPVLFLDADLRVRRTNRAYCRLFRAELDQVEGRPFHELGGGQWAIPLLLSLLRDVLPNGTEIRDFQVDQVFPGIGRRSLLINAQRIFRDEAPNILFVLQDITPAV
jgi:two-component system CheB/CheR fusion protein